MSTRKLSIHGAEILFCIRWITLITPVDWIQIAAGKMTSSLIYFYWHLKQKTLISSQILISQLWRRIILKKWDKITEFLLRTTAILEEVVKVHQSSSHRRLLKGYFTVLLPTVIRMNAGHHNDIVIILGPYSYKTDHFNTKKMFRLISKNSRIAKSLRERTYWEYKHRS